MKKKSRKDELVRIYVRPETYYHLTKMMLVSHLRFPGQVVDKLIRTKVVSDRAYLSQSKGDDPYNDKDY